MSIIAWIILGLIAGYIGSRIVDKEGKGVWLKHGAGDRRRDCRWGDFQRLWRDRRHWGEPI